MIQTREDLAQKAKRAIGDLNEIMKEELNKGLSFMVMDANFDLAYELCEMGKPIIAGSNLVRDDADIQESDIVVLEKVFRVLGEYSINDNRGAWNTGTFNHYKDVALVVQASAEAIAPKLDLPINTAYQVVYSQIHDLGRMVDQGPTAHGLWGVYMCAKMGVRADLILSCIGHLYSAQSIDLDDFPGEPCRDIHEMTLGTQLTTLADMSSKRGADGKLIDGYTRHMEWKGQFTPETNAQFEIERLNGELNYLMIVGNLLVQYGISFPDVLRELNARLPEPEFS